MCQATVYIVQNGQRQEMMREVIRLVPIEDGVRLEAFFEEPRTLPGRIAEIDFLKHTVTLVPCQKEEHHAD